MGVMGNPDSPNSPTRRKKAMMEIEHDYKLKRISQDLDGHVVKFILKDLRTGRMFEITPVADYYGERAWLEMREPKPTSEKTDYV